MQQQEREKIQVEELRKEIDLIQNCIKRMDYYNYCCSGYIVTSGS